MSPASILLDLLQDSEALKSTLADKDTTCTPLLSNSILIVQHRATHSHVMSAETQPALPLSQMSTCDADYNFSGVSIVKYCERDMKNINECEVT